MQILNKYKVITSQQLHDSSKKKSATLMYDATTVLRRKRFPQCLNRTAMLLQVSALILDRQFFPCEPGTDHLPLTSLCHG